MKPAQCTFAALGLVMATAALAAEDEGQKSPAAADKPAWSFAITAYPTMVHGGDDYTSAIATADHGPLHLEARYNYESDGARSAFIGWTFSGGNEVTWQLRPIVGGVWGTTEAVVPGLEAAVAWGRFDFYTEAEYVNDRNSARSSSYLYSWNEFGFRPVESLRFGLVAQHTRAYGGDRDIQPGPFAQVTWRRLTIGGYWFNPGSSDEVVVLSIGAAF